MSLEAETEQKYGTIIGGWICLFIGTVLMFWTLFSFVIYLPLFLAAFVLGIVSIVQRRIFHGVTILLLSIILPFVIGPGLAYYRTHQPSTSTFESSNIQRQPSSGDYKNSQQKSLTSSNYDNFYGYDIITYCKKVSATVGGSYMIEDSCRKHEYEARNKINSMQVPLEIKNYCKQAGETVGGSYQVTESCIRHEIEAKRNLDLESAPRNQANNQMPNQSDSLVGDSIKDVDSTGLMKGYKRYKNDRFGFTIDYPRNFIAKEPPQNGDGITLNSPDGRATLTVFGQNNSSGATVRQYYEMSIKETHSGSGYRKIKGNWYVITWKDSSNMLNYLKMFVGNGSLNGFIFRYPISQKIAYDDAVIRMEKSFMPGNLDQAW